METHSRAIDREQQRKKRNITRIYKDTYNTPVGMLIPKEAFHLRLPLVTSYNNNAAIIFQHMSKQMQLQLYHSRIFPVRQLTCRTAPMSYIHPSIFRSRKIFQLKDRVSYFSIQHFARDIDVILSSLNMVNVCRIGYNVAAMSF